METHQSERSRTLERPAQAKKPEYLSKRDFSSKREKKTMHFNVKPIQVHPDMEKNPILAKIKASYQLNKETRADFEVNDRIWLYFLTMKYHMEKPLYLKNRLPRGAIANKNLYLLLVMDDPDHSNLLQEIQLQLFPSCITLLKASDFTQAAQYVQMLY